MHGFRKKSLESSRLSGSSDDQRGMHTSLGALTAVCTCGRCLQRSTNGLLIRKLHHATFLALLLIQKILVGGEMVRGPPFITARNP